jgi:carbamoyl-phosphate synthase large subunit
MAAELDVIGLMNVQYAIQANRLCCHRGQPARLAHRALCQQSHRCAPGQTGHQDHAGPHPGGTGPHHRSGAAHISVKEAVLPFDRFPDVDTLLGPEMKSTGEVMGIDTDFGAAYAKAQLGAGQRLPLSGTVFISVMDRDKPAIVEVARKLRATGLFSLVTTSGTHDFLDDHGYPASRSTSSSRGGPMWKMPSKTARSTW